MAKLPHIDTQRPEHTRGETHVFNGQALMRAGLLQLTGWWR